MNVFQGGKLTQTYTTTFHQIFCQFLPDSEVILKCRVQTTLLRGISRHEWVQGIGEPLKQPHNNKQPSTLPLQLPALAGFPGMCLNPFMPII